jgi:ribonuclease BN (tRNA processing enzyme)
MGFPFFKPLYLDQTDIRIHGCPFAQKFVEIMLNKVMSPPNFPVRYSDIKAHINITPECAEVIEIGTVSITSIRLSHPNQGNGYKFIEDDKTFVFLTDNELDFIHPGGLPFEEYVKFSEGADLLIHDSEYTKEEYTSTRQWGHSVYTTALELALAANVKHFGLFHLNQDRTDKDVDRMVDICKDIIKARDSALECFAVSCDMEFNL